MADEKQGVGPGVEQSDEANAAQAAEMGIRRAVVEDIATDLEEWLPGFGGISASVYVRLLARIRSHKSKGAKS